MLSSNLKSDVNVGLQVATMLGQRIQGAAECKLDTEFATDTYYRSCKKKCGYRKGCGNMYLKFLSLDQPQYFSIKIKHMAGLFLSQA